MPKTNNINGYTLLRNWYNFKFENPDKVRHIHSDFYCYLVDAWNRYGQKPKFGLPTLNTMELMGIGSYNTYKKALNDLIGWGFVILVKDSKNQHHSKVVALSFFDKATDKALDKATIKATDKPTDTIIEQRNKGTIKPINNYFQDVLLNEKFLEWIDYRKEIKKSMKETTIQAQIKKLIKFDSDTAIKMIDQSIENGWTGLFDLKKEKEKTSGKKEKTTLTDRLEQAYEIQQHYKNRRNENN